VFTRDERRALVFLAAVTAAGGAIRVTRSAGPAPAAAAIAPGLPGEDLVQQAALSRRAEALARPLEPGERVDVDRASAAELERLPRVGKRLAARIAADRRANGPFGSLEALGRVPGVSARLRSDLEPWVTFSGGPQAAVTSPASVFPRPPSPSTRGAEAPKAPGGCPSQVSLNRATREELACLPGIGPVLAERIAADREAHGPFREIGDLARIPGIGTRRIERLKRHATIP
jgi:competence ComEA-like helix-hairpin-helix protein